MMRRKTTTPPLQASCARYRSRSPRSVASSQTILLHIHLQSRIALRQHHSLMFLLVPLESARCSRRSRAAYHNFLVLRRKKDPNLSSSQALATQHLRHWLQRIERHVIQLKRRQRGRQVQRVRRRSKSRKRSIGLWLSEFVPAFSMDASANVTTEHWLACSRVLTKI